MRHTKFMSENLSTWREKETCQAHIIKTSEKLEQEKTRCVRSLQRCRSTNAGHAFLSTTQLAFWAGGRGCGQILIFWVGISDLRMHVLNWEHKRLWLAFLEAVAANKLEQRKNRNFMTLRKSSGVSLFVFVTLQRWKMMIFYNGLFRKLLLFPLKP